MQKEAEGLFQQERAQKRNGYFLREPVASDEHRSNLMEAFRILLQVERETIELVETDIALRIDAELHVRCAARSTETIVLPRHREVPSLNPGEVISALND